MKTISKPIEQMETIDEVIGKMTQRIQNLEKKEDYRAIFQRVYLLMTQEMQRRLESGFFEDPIWMERVLVGFARYYFKASTAYETGESCP
ncbi:hypothetical protein HM131_17540 [Halobacillus mangrovi]|uniref:Uncharacterized protein n=1 Tax=Halobacillus mangrovi TaxID=402384 RepID=A0A1W5ZYX8_9BACI|nr:hypothetical protein HM131_17540 [Halobacillus mangrovi]